MGATLATAALDDLAQVQASRSHTNHSCSPVFVGAAATDWHTASVRHSAGHGDSSRHVTPRRTLTDQIPAAGATRPSGGHRRPMVNQRGVGRREVPGLAVRACQQCSTDLRIARDNEPPPEGRGGGGRRHCTGGSIGSGGVLAAQGEGSFIDSGR